MNRTRNTRRGSHVAALATLALFGSVVPAGAQVPATDGTEGRGGIPQASTPALVTGTITDESGNPLAVDLHLVAWPSESRVEAMEVGEAVPVTRVAETTSAEDGSFELRIDSATPMDEFSNDAGIVNFDIVSTGSEASATYSFSRRQIEAGNTAIWIDALQEPRGHEEPATLHLPIDVTMVVGGTSTETSTSSEEFDAAYQETLGSAPSDTNALPGTELLAIAPTLASSSGTCPVTLVKTYTAQWDLVGELYNYYSKGQYTYTTGANSVLGIGYSASGAYGSFKASGTASKSSTSTQGFPTYGEYAMRYLDTKFQYGLYAYYGYNGFYCSFLGYYARPYKFFGGVSARTVSTRPTATHCTSFASGSFFVTENATASTWSNGMKMGSQIGIDLSSRTGWTSAAKLRYDFTRASKACGNNNPPPSAARVVVKP